MAHGKAASLRFVPKKPLSFIAAVPAEPLSTARARQAIPETVSHKDAVFNAGRSALLVSALLTGEYKFLPDALEDRLHQPYRMPLINGTQAEFKAAKNAGAYGAIISGAGATATTPRRMPCVKPLGAPCSRLLKKPGSRRCTMC